MATDIITKILMQSLRELERHATPQAEQKQQQQAQSEKKEPVDPEVEADKKLEKLSQEFQRVMDHLKQTRETIRKSKEAIEQIGAQCPEYLKNVMQCEVQRKTKEWDLTIEAHLQATQLQTHIEFKNLGHVMESFLGSLLFE